MKRFFPAAALSVSAGALLFVFVSGGKIWHAAPDVQAPVVETPLPVSCLGRVIAGERLLKVAAPVPLPIRQIFVQRGDRVDKGMILATLSNYDIGVAEVNYARAQVEVAAGELARVEAGARPHELTAQLAVIEQAQLEFNAAAKNLTRDQQLFEVKSVSERSLDASELRHQVAAKNLEQQQQLLANLKHIREVDIVVAQKHLAAAEAKLACIQAELENRLIRSPVAGEIIEINSCEGEMPPLDRGVFVVGQTDQPLLLLAEVYVSDVSRVKPGAAVIAMIDGSTMPVQGYVSEILKGVRNNELMDLDPLARRDRRIVLVRIQLQDHDQDLTRLINSQASVRILP